MSPRWISLCCGLAATECRAMTGRFPTVARMGGKRAYADGVLDILGTWPKRWLLVDADLAIVEFWQAAFAGLLPAVAEVIRNAPADGEELWRLWTSEPVPFDPVERVARWIVLQKGNFSVKPLSYYGLEWSGVAGWGDVGTGFGVAADSTVAARLAAWSGVAGFAALSPLAYEKSFRDRIVREDLVDKAGEWWTGIAGWKRESKSSSGNWASQKTIDREKVAEAVSGCAPFGEALYLDLSTSSPVVNPGDLVTIDPPYQGTSGYGSALSRERVAELAAEADERGARVLVHEAEPILTGGSWRALELPRTYGGNQRTWSRQKHEWVTINFEPATAHPGAKARGSRQRLASRREMAPISGPLFKGAPP